MNKILYRMMLPVVALAAMLTSCSEDRDCNPTFHEPAADGLVLNMPANAANNTYDLALSNSLTLTTSQPNYGGFPLVTAYHVQVSLSNSFNEQGVDFVELESVYKQASMQVSASELNNAMLNLFAVANPDIAYPDAARPLYVRLRANVDGQSIGNCYSNVITLPNVLAKYVPPTLELPTELYIVGSSIGDAWSTWKPFAPVYGNAGEFYTICYFPDGAEFKWGEYEGNWRGYKDIAAFDDQAGAGLSDADNVKVANGGWYLVYVESKIGETAIKYTFHLYPAAAYVIGAVAGDAWTDSDAAWALTAPADASQPWESPAFAKGGELRAYIKVPGIDWWRTEFTLATGGSLYWRTVDIPDNWAENVGEAYSVSCSAGQKLYVDFNSNKGEVK